MANILPELGATGSAPLIMHLQNVNMTVDGGIQTVVGVTRSAGTKTRGGLDFQNSESGVQWQTNFGGGPNGYMWTAGLNNTDFSNAVFLGHFSGNAWNRIHMSPKANNGFEFHLGSSVGNNNVRHWCIGGSDTLVGQAVGRHLIVCDPTQPGTRIDTGTFDIASLDEQGFTCDTSNSWDTTYNWWYWSRFCKILKTRAGACGVYGTDASLSSCAIEAVTKAWALIETSSGNFTINTPFKFGDGVTTLTNPDSNCVLTAPTPAKDAGDDRYHLTDESLPFYCDPAGETVTFTNYTFNWGIPSEFDFDNDTNANWTWNNATFNGFGLMWIGYDHDIYGTANPAGTGGADIVLNGGQFHGTINGDVEMVEESDLNDLTINGMLDVVAYDWNLTLDNVQVSGDLTNVGPFGLTVTATNGTTFGNVLNVGTAPLGPGEIEILRPVSIAIHVTDTDGVAIQGARVEVSANQTVGSLTDQDVILTGVTDVNGDISTASFNYEDAFGSGLEIVIKVRQGTVSPYKRPAFGTGTITSTGYSVVVALLADE